MTVGSVVVAARSPPAARCGDRPACRQPTTARTRSCTLPRVGDVFTRSACSSAPSGRSRRVLTSRPPHVPSSHRPPSMPTIHRRRRTAPSDDLAPDTSGISGASRDAMCGRGALTYWGVAAGAPTLVGAWREESAWQMASPAIQSRPISSAEWDDLTLLLNIDNADDVGDEVATWPPRQLAAVELAAVSMRRSDAVGPVHPWPQVGCDRGSAGHVATQS